MPPLREDLVKRGERLAILRLDGDMYDSTVDVLYNLYERVEIGGYIVIDDFDWMGSRSFGARDAVIDFRALHGIEDEAHAMQPIDRNGAFWRKSREVEVRRDAYLQSIGMSANSSASGQRYNQAILRPPNLHVVDKAFYDLRGKWEESLGEDAVRRHRDLIKVRIQQSQQQKINALKEWWGVNSKILTRQVSSPLELAQGSALLTGEQKRLYAEFIEDFADDLVAMHLDKNLLKTLERPTYLLQLQKAERQRRGLCSST